MFYELKITAPNQSGFFSRILVAVRRQGHQPNVQKRELQGATQVVILKLEGMDEAPNALARDIEALGATVKLTAQQPVGTIRVGRQVLQVGDEPGSSRTTKAAAATAQPVETIRVGRQILMVEAQPADAMREETIVRSEPSAGAGNASVIRAGRQILETGTQPAIARRPIADREPLGSREYTGGLSVRSA